MSKTEERSSLVKSNLTSDRKAVEIRVSTAVATGLFQEGYAAGWNALNTIIAKHYDPLNDAHASLESVIGTLRGIVMSGAASGRLEGAKEWAGFYGTVIGNLLNELDVHNRGLASLLGGADFLDLSLAQEIRAAALDFSNGTDPEGSQLIALLRDQNAYVKRAASMLSAMKPTRSKDRHEITREQAALVKKYVDLGNGLTAACSKAVKEWEETREGTYTFSAFSSAYYRVYGKRRK